MQRTAPPDGRAPSTRTVTGLWTDRRGAVIKGLGRLVTGVADRPVYAATSIEQTLAGIKALAEAGVEPAR